jgi:hypothetical protein
MDTEKKFNWLAFFFASAYYAGYGKIGKALVFAFAGIVPLAALVANIYAGVKANRELPIGSSPFKWIPAIAVAALAVAISATSAYALQQRMKSTSLPPPAVLSSESSSGNVVEGVVAAFDCGDYCSVRLEGSDEAYFCFDACEGISEESVGRSYRLGWAMQTADLGGGEMQFKVIQSVEAL